MIKVNILYTCVVFSHLTNVFDSILTNGCSSLKLSKIPLNYRIGKLNGWQINIDARLIDVQLNSQVFCKPTATGHRYEFGFVRFCPRRRAKIVFDEIFPEEREERTRTERNGEARRERSGHGQRRWLFEDIEITFDHRQRHLHAGKTTTIIECDRNCDQLI